MTAKVFVDSNILIYAHDKDAGSKHQQAVDGLSELWESHAGCLSTQVLQEFYVNVTQKVKKPLRRGLAREIVRNYSPWVEAAITVETVVRAAEIAEIWQLSFWDSMIVAAAEEVGAAELLTEDLNSGQVIAAIRVVNPFV
ncbi:MAG: PIN domain-containing protein [Acidobacteria bacterium]|nr:PIN domain-containing protein [Acidobacteriota bacterium]